jgi:hypothetical protein
MNTTLRHALFLLLVLATKGLCCDFFALLAQNGTTLLDSPAAVDFYFDRLESTSNASENDDGYGVVYYGSSPWLADEQSFYLSCEIQVECHFLSDDAPMLAARQALGELPAVISLAHARNGTGGYGNHPFTFDHGERTYSFMHNGTLYRGDNGDFKPALLEGLRRAGWFEGAGAAGSNWRGAQEDLSSWIDSELLFHYLLSFILEADGNVHAGLVAAMNQRNFFGFDVREALLAESGASVINFVLCDGEGLFAFRNTDLSGHKMWVDADSTGFFGLCTGTSSVGDLLAKHTLLHIPLQGGTTETSVFEDGSDCPATFTWVSAAPNPFNALTRISFYLNESSDTSVKIFNLQGQLMRQLHQGVLAEGSHVFSWNGESERGLSAASGVYFFSLTSQDDQHAQKILLVK